MLTLTPPLGVFWLPPKHYGNLEDKCGVVHHLSCQGCDGLGQRPRVFSKQELSSIVATHSPWVITMASINIKATKKKSWFSSNPSSNFVPSLKKSHAPRQILILGKHVKCKHFSDDMVFSLALVIFQKKILIRTKTFISQFQKKKRKSLTLIIFLLFFSENQDICFSWTKATFSVCYMTFMNFSY